MDLTLNLDGVSSGFDAIPPGDYSAILSEWEATKFQTGSTGAKLEFTITEDEFQGRKLWSNLVLTQKALWKVKEFLTAMELWTPEELEGSINLSEALDQAVGEELTLRVVQHLYDGETRNNVKKFLAA